MYFISVDSLMAKCYTTELSCLLLLRKVYSTRHPKLSSKLLRPLYAHLSLQSQMCLNF